MLLGTSNIKKTIKICFLRFLAFETNVETDKFQEDGSSVQNTVLNSVPCICGMALWSEVQKNSIGFARPSISRNLRHSLFSWPSAVI